MDIHQHGVSIKTGVDEDTQEREFINATLQNAGRMVAVSVATYIDIPETVYFRGQEAVAEYMQQQLSRVTAVVPGVDFEVQIGLSTEAARLTMRNRPGGVRLKAV